MEYTSKIVDHLGIVAGVCEEIGLVKEIDNLVGINPCQKVTTGEAVEMMVLNALGFVSKPLYLYPEYIENKSMCIFFREELMPEEFNDDMIGRALDRLFENDPTKIFMQIAFVVTRKFNIPRKSCHLDTSTISVHGEYASKDDDIVPISITYGHSKEGRNDLKQFTVSLITEPKADLPIWIAALNGNASDKKHFVQVIKDYSKMLKENDEQIRFVMDSAGYTEDNVKTISPLVKWVSRVPETMNDAKSLIIATDKNDMSACKQEGYRYKEYPNLYGGVKQKWVVVYSQQAYDREEKTVKKNIKKERVKIEKEVWHFGNADFKCKEDGLYALEKMARKWKYHRVKKYNIIAEKRFDTRGRPKKVSSQTKIVYRMKALFEDDIEKIQKAENKIGKFIVATNDLALDGEDALTEYKGQQSVERGFRFIKDPMFFASSVFLKTPKRIVSLVMIMALSLLVYSLAQYRMREALKKYKETVPDQKKKPTSKPTMRWIFQQFEGIHMLEYVEDGKVIRRVLNLKDVHRKIIKLLGPVYEKTYFLAERPIN